MVALISVFIALKIAGIVAWPWTLIGGALAIHIGINLAVALIAAAFGITTTSTATNWKRF